MCADAGGAQQQRGDAVREHAVNLFGHGWVMRPQAGFDMRHGYLQLGSRQRPGQRGVGVAVHQHPIGLFLLNQRFDVLQHAPGHRAVAKAGNAKIMMRLGDVQLLEEDVRHIGIEMLPGMNDDLFDVIARLDGTADGGGLNELRTGAEDGEDFHRLYLAAIPAAGYL